MTGGITTKAVAGAARTVLGLSLNRQKELVDRIYAAQPQILLAVLSLSREDVVRSAKRHEAMIAYLEQEPDPEMRLLTSASYPEPALLAYIVNYLLENGVSGLTEAQYKASSMSKVVLDLYVDAFRGWRERDAGGKRSHPRAGV